MDKKEIVGFLKSSDDSALFKKADTVRGKFCGEDVHLRALIEFSNYCKRDCLYCGLRKSNGNITRYRMSLDEIFATVKAAGELDYKTVVLQSGEDDYYKIKDLCVLVERIKKEVNCAVTLGIGEKSRGEYRQLKNAGTDRYLLKIETSDKKLFTKLKPDSSFEERLGCLKVLKELGYQAGSGFMVGLPCQTVKILANDILLMKELDIDMIGIGPFIPHHFTPLQNEQGGNLEDALRVCALTRIVTEDTHMPATTAIGTINSFGWQKALQYGANVLMPNVTPLKYRQYYEIYPDKICIKDLNCTLKEKRLEIMSLIKSLGRTTGRGYGHCL